MNLRIRVQVNGLAIDEATETEPERLEIPFRIMGIPQVERDKFSAWIEQPYTAARIKNAIRNRCIEIKAIVQQQLALQEQFGDVKEFTVEIP